MSTAQYLLGEMILEKNGLVVRPDTLPNSPYHPVDGIEKVKETLVLSKGDILYLTCHGRETSLEPVYHAPLQDKQKAAAENHVEMICIFTDANGRQDPSQYMPVVKKALKSGYRCLLQRPGIA